LQSKAPLRLSSNNRTKRVAVGIGSGQGPEVVTRKKRSTINIIIGGIIAIRPTMKARGLLPVREEKRRRRIKKRKKPMRMPLSPLLTLLNSQENRKNNLKSS
jgi:hypothetical protein